MKLVIAITAILIQSAIEIQAHVALIFPPARRLDLDFLDNVRTQGVCGGMPKGNIITTIPNGQKLQVDWHLGYAHQGGFRLELLNENGQVDLDFTNGFNSEDKFATSFEIDIPSSLVSKGILRLTRQASEWTNYEFYSCADVEIVDASNYIEADCLNNGQASGSYCNCDKNHYGNRCQYLTDCQSDSDCNNSIGKCVENTGTALPKKECYCPLGYFGRTCEQVSDLKVKGFNETDYKVETLRGENFKFLWRTIGQFNDILEGVIIGKTNSFVAVGWRDQNEDPQCQMFPKDVGHPSIPRQLHPMDCQDIIIGKANEFGSNVGDYYTRDRSTPRRDEIYGGQDDLTAAAGWQEDGVTTIMFRKPVNSPDNADNPFEAELRFIYAYGQNGQDFYKEDELKYHGGNRGSKVIQGKLSSSASSVDSLVLLVFLNAVVFIQTL